MMRGFYAQQIDICVRDDTLRSINIDPTCAGEVSREVETFWVIYVGNPR